MRYQNLKTAMHIKILHGFVSMIFLLTFLCGAVSYAEDSGAVAISRAKSKQACGANCLFLICQYYDIPITYESMKQLLPPSDLGVSMLSLKSTAEQLGFETRALRISPKDLTLFANPMIVRAAKSDAPEFPYGHFVVIVPESEQNGGWVFDPPSKAKWAEVQEPDKPTDVRVEVLLLRPRTTSSQATETSKDASGK